ncbi:AMP-binding enzyme family protein [Mycobacterium xenopi 3993]|nr:AMP-binding enzyme family protein [Mycobacterium xenopi 3993]
MRQPTGSRICWLAVGRPGGCVALLFSRSAEAIVAILAVLKTGAAYLPIDPALPAARIGFMLADAAPIAVLTTGRLRDRLDEFAVPVLDVNDPPSIPNPARSFSGRPDDIAHIIYTSGTTGTPKGVAVTHHNVTRLFDGLEVGLELARARCGRSAIPMRSTTRSGRSGLRCCTVAGWSWCPSR